MRKYGHVAETEVGAFAKALRRRRDEAGGMCFREFCGTVRAALNNRIKPTPYGSKL